MGFVMGAPKLRVVTDLDVQRAAEQHLLREAARLATAVSEAQRNNKQVFPTARGLRLPVGSHGLPGRGARNEWRDVMSYTWNGPAGKGAMKALRAQKRAEAEERNAAGNPVWMCKLGHRHGANMTCPAGA